MSRYTLILILIIFLRNILIAGDSSSVIDSPRILSMGNTYIAVNGGYDSAFFNPAFFAKSDNTFIVQRLTVGLNSDAMILYTGLSSDIENFTGNPDFSNIPSDLIDDLNNLQANFRITGPLFLSYQGDNFGIMLFNSLNGNVSFTGASLPSTSMNLDFDITVVTGFGITIPIETPKKHSLSAGLNFKYVNRVRFSRQDVPFFKAGTIVNPFSLSSDFLMGQAIGVDIGLAYKNNGFTAGLILTDFFGMTFSWKKYNSRFQEYTNSGAIEDTRVSPSLGAGVAYKLKNIFNIDEKIISKISFAFDIRDIFVEENSFFNMLHMGMEFLILQTLTFRFGYNQGYPTLGLAFSILDIIILEYTLYTYESGIMPGQNPITYHFLSSTIKL